MTRLEQLKKLAQACPDDPLSHYGVGLELIQLERWGEAAEAFGRALTADPGYSAAYYHKARSLIHAGAPAAARPTLERGVQVAQAAGDLKTVGEMRELLESLE
jgi:tetratricopeptide (TPR) repeat protein